MTTAGHADPSRSGRDAATNPGAPPRTVESLAAHMAGAFATLDVKRRARLLGRLLGSVGPLALAVIGGGAFVKYLPEARSPVVPVSLDDAALATSSQVYELVRYVGQADPNLIEALLRALAHDGVAMTALGASIAATAISHFANRRGRGRAPPRQDP